MIEREVLHKKDVKALKREKLKAQHLLLLIFIFFTSRVLFLREIMPFGIALLIASTMILDKEWIMVCGLFSVLGYLTESNVLAAKTHIFLTVWVMILNLFIKSEKKRLFILLASTSILNVLASVFAHKYFLKNLVLYDVIISSFESLIIISSAYLFTYGLAYFFNKKNVELLKEELISLVLIFLISYAGLWDISYKYVSLKSVLAVLVILTSAYIKDGQVAASVGLLLGLVSSFAGNISVYLVAVYGLCGLVAGALKDLGRIITSVAFMITSVVVMMYANKVDVLFTLEVNILFASIIFILLPSSILDKLNLALDFENKREVPQKLYVERIKDYINGKLNIISKSLNGLASVLAERYENNLSKVNEVKGTVEKIANKVCSNCEGRHFCWQRETYYTYDVFCEMLRMAEKNGKLDIKQVPNSFNLKCVKLNEIIRQINFEMEIIRLNNRWNKKLLNSKIVLAEQIKGISVVVSDLVKDITKSVEFKNELEDKISMVFDINGIKYNDVMVTKNSNNKYEVTIYGVPCQGKTSCSSDVPKLVSQVLGKRMIRENAMCKLDENNKMCHYKLIEAENYGVASAVARFSKEEISGDSYYFGNVAPGKYIIAISDGMGSGFEAAMESNTTITLIEKFMEAGFDRNTTMKAINSILLLKNNSESFATVDLGIIDLYEGIGEFIKVGAVSTFIKSGFDVEIIENKNLPIGIIEDIEIESEIYQFKNGDMIIMVSDGVIDADNELKDKWISKLLREYSGGNPRDLADYILQRSKEKYGDNIKDDLTVIVSKIWKM